MQNQLLDKALLYLPSMQQLTIQPFRSFNNEVYKRKSRIATLRWIGGE
jgi:hypothetical protein